jgi:M6 family metalloprotease-like protein
MKLYRSTFAFTLLILFLSQPSFLASQAGRISVGKDYMQNEENEQTILRKTHPAESYFVGRRSRPIPKQGVERESNFNKLLVLLVDFQEDDDPLTTGNGKFQLDFDPDYPVSIGAPPRDYDFFDYHLETMRYYYLAASLGIYNLDYDLYPTKDDAQFAYTLPQQMGYYNPGLEDYDLFIERIEEYFLDVFTTADSDGVIDFSQYGHFMIIHAGSDWQHDVYGDTPSDIPSFFIQVAEGKEAVVNNGAVKISHAANVPETISQDDRYGVVNAVIAHEFGHSLGFVDLYNVNNFNPGVGYWDIMDSGGLGKLVLLGNDGEAYEIEGGLPTLPSAWHRLLVWEDEFRDMGVYYDITDFKTAETIELEAASALYDPLNPKPRILKVPLSNSEYLLLENRHVDPDGDGGIAFRGAHPISSDGQDYRVLLHPTRIEEGYTDPTYEYDWLLPGWMDRQGNSFGGGVIAWHIDDKIIFEQGVTLDDGTFRSNYENNSVNTRYRNRGVKIIEADDIQDIGNVYSWYWHGTEYEPFFRYLPLLDADAFFTGWSSEYFSYNLSAMTKPSLKTNSGYPSIFSINNISSPSGVMTLNYTFEPFVETVTLSDNTDYWALAPPGGSSFPGVTSVLPAFSNEGVTLYRHFYDSEGGDDYWEDLFGPTALPSSLTHPVVMQRVSSGNTRYFLPAINKLIVLEDAGLDFDLNCLTLDDDIVESPLVFDKGTDTAIFLATTERVLVIKLDDLEVIAAYDLPDARMTSDGELVYVISEGYISSFDLDEILSQNNYQKDTVVTGRRMSRRANDTINSSEAFIPDYSSSYDPLFYKDKNDDSHNALFIQNDKGNIYRYANNQLEQFFNLTVYTEAEPTQIGIGNIDSRAAIFFAAGEYIFVIDLDGTIVQSYPKHLENYSFEPYSHPRFFTIDDRRLFVFAVEGEGYMVYEYMGSIVPELSLIWDKRSLADQLYWEEESGKLYFIFSDNQKKLFASVFDLQQNDPIVWNGYRNSQWSMYESTHENLPASSGDISVYVYPNPVRVGEARIRIEKADDEVDLKIYDVTGKIVMTEKIAGSIPHYYDIPFSVDKLSTGVYFGTVETKGKSTQFRFAVEK